MNLDKNIPRTAPETVRGSSARKQYKETVQGSRTRKQKKSPGLEPVSPGWISRIDLQIGFPIGFPVGFPVGFRLVSRIGTTKSNKYSSFPEQNRLLSLSTAGKQCQGCRGCNHCSYASWGKHGETEYQIRNKPGHASSAVSHSVAIGTSSSLPILQQPKLVSAGKLIATAPAWEPPLVPP